MSPILCGVFLEVPEFHALFFKILAAIQLLGMSCLCSLSCGVSTLRTVFRRFRPRRPHHSHAWREGIMLEMEELLPRNSQSGALTWVHA